MWVRTTLTIKRWTEARTGVRVDARDESDSSDMNRLPSWKRGRLRARMSSSTDLSTFSSEGECKETERCCWKHRQCARHITHPVSDYGHHKLYLHTKGHCDCDSRPKDCSEKANSSSSRDMGTTCSRDGRSNCFNILQNPCFELIPEEECMEPFWYSWCNSYRPLSVAVIHHPVHHEYGADNLNGDEEEEEEENQPPITTQVGPTATPSDRDNSSVTGSPDLAVPITIWRSDSPREEKSQDSKVLKKIKKKEKDDEMMDEKKLKKKVKKSKLTKKKSPVKSESSPAELSRSVSPRELARTSESSPESREELESEDSYNNRGQREPSSEDVVESSSSSKKREKCTPQAKKNGTKTSQTRKVTKRKSPPVSNPSHS